MQFATTYDIKLTPLPACQHLTERQRQTEIRHMIKEIEEQADATTAPRAASPWGGGDSCPRSHTRGRPLPIGARHQFVHASDKKTRLEFVPSTAPTLMRFVPHRRLKACAAKLQTCSPYGPSAGLAVQRPA